MRPSHQIKKGRQKESKEWAALRKSLLSIGRKCGLTPKASKKYAERVLQASKATAQVLKDLDQYELCRMREGKAPRLFPWM